MSKKRKEPFGRPTKYKPEYCEMLLKHMGSGYSFESFAATIDVARSSLYEWEKEYPDFSDAKHKGVDKSLYFWESVGIEGLWNKPYGKTLNNKVFEMNIKNKHGWADKQEIDSVNTEIKLAYNVDSKSN